MHKRITPLVTILALCSFSLPEVAAAASDSGTLLVGQGALSICQTNNHLPIPFYGYDASTSVGSYSPTGLTGGHTVSNLGDNVVISCSETVSFSNISISGFSSNPSSGWLSSVDCNGVKNLASNAGYSYLNGRASWAWGTLFGLKAKKGTNVSCTIVHS